MPEAVTVGIACAHAALHSHGAVERGVADRYVHGQRIIGCVAKVYVAPRIVQDESAMAKALQAGDETVAQKAALCWCGGG
ncbi:hypothetical protein GCM10007863_35010 [Dyella mobilis]|nr:hypothetical protein GCM10007863_35010 [Dyella mobilis]